MTLTTPSTAVTGRDGGAARSPSVAAFRILSGGELMSWSDPMYRAHGFEPGDVVPTTALTLSHCHREDRPALEALLRDPAPARSRTLRYRLVDAAGEEHPVLALVHPAGDARAVAEGVLVDLAAEVGSLAARRADEMLAAAVASREVIDQAKGALMLAYRVDGATAFDLLRWHSEHLNVKVRTVAEEVVAGVAGGSRGGPHEVVDAALAALSAPRTGAVVPLVPSAVAGGGDRLATRRAAEGRRVTLHVAGEVDGATVPMLVTALRDALRQVPPHGTLVLDLSGLRRLGPVADLHVERLYRRAEQHGVTIRVVPPRQGGTGTPSVPAPGVQAAAAQSSMGVDPDPTRRTS